MESLPGFKSSEINFNEWNEEIKKRFDSEIKTMGKALEPLVNDFTESVINLHKAITGLLEECNPGLIKLLQSIGYTYAEYEENIKEERMAARARRIHKMSHGKHGMKRPK